MKSYQFHPEARQDYVEAARHYAAISVELAQCFHEEVETLLEEIRFQPDRWPFFDPPARRRVSDQFPYAVIYWDQPDTLWIVALMHFRRRPGYWRDRLE